MNSLLSHTHSHTLAILLHLFYPPLQPLRMMFSLQPDAWLCREGLARFATVPYVAPSAANLDQPYMHLTNYSLNKVKQRAREKYGALETKTETLIVLGFLRSRKYQRLLQQCRVKYMPFLNDFCILREIVSPLLHLLFLFLLFFLGFGCVLRRRTQAADVRSVGRARRRRRSRLGRGLGSSSC